MNGNEPDASNGEGKAFIKLLMTSLGEEGGIDMVGKGKGKDTGGFNRGKGYWPMQSAGKGGKADGTMNLLATVLRAIKGQQGGKGWKGNQWNQQPGRGWSNRGKGQRWTNWSATGEGCPIQKLSQLWQTWTPGRGMLVSQTESVGTSG